MTTWLHDTCSRTSIGWSKGRNAVTAVVLKQVCGDRVASVSAVWGHFPWHNASKGVSEKEERHCISIPQCWPPIMNEDHFGASTLRLESACIRIEFEQERLAMRLVSFVINENPIFTPVAEENRCVAAGLGTKNHSVDAACNYKIIFGKAMRHWIGNGSSNTDGKDTMWYQKGPVFGWKTVVVQDQAIGLCPVCLVSIHLGIMASFVQLSKVQTQRWRGAVAIKLKPSPCCSART